MSDAIALLMAKARRSGRKAERDLREGDLDFAVSRAHYAMFYAAEALLAARGEHYSSHLAVIGAYGRHFARTRLLDPEFHRHLLDAYELRIKADYSVDPLPEEAGSAVRWAQEFLEAATRYLATPPRADGDAP